MDKAGKKYWEGSWSGAGLPAPINPRDMRSGNKANRSFHRVFSRLFGGPGREERKLLEIGCARLAWLPYFAKEFGFSVSGLDYSPTGCDMARKVLEAAGVEGEVICGDLFAAPEALAGAFDAVVSFGVAEHFDDTAACVGAISRFLKPGGLLVTSVPNLTGWIGTLQKLVNRPVYDIHRRLSPDELRRAHERAGLEVLECGYFMSTDFGGNNLAGVTAGTASWLLKRILLSVLARASRLVWSLEDRTMEFPPNRLSSPHIICAARRRQRSSMRQS